MSDFKVIHYSPTPLVGAPSKIVKMLNRSGNNAIWLIGGDYPVKGPLFNKFSVNAFNLSSISKTENEFVNYFISKADVFHIHNDISKETANLFYTLNSHAKYLYQVHSPIQEGPLYCDRSESIKLPFSKKLVVGQYQPRHYQDFFLVPNIILDRPTVNLRKDYEKLRIIFSPTHSRGGRWNSKYSEKLNKVLSSFNELNLIDLVLIDEPIKPELLMEIRKSCHVSIDEIVTGAYHQVSLEGLCAGNIVLNFADHFSCAMLKHIADSEEYPPFIRVNELNIEDTILRLIFDTEYCRNVQMKSFNYFNDYLDSDILIKHFLKVYCE